ncbi:SDR family NAD(P)-dependent oxidoreductase [Micromonospora sp. NPDC004540]|uniref:SDR family NAD(P)-dependent oxidoreductase n=1 Tax=Micromonospora sp. NPDC004540 TaxID=3154457 RepID=UPI0033B5310A
MWLVAPTSASTFTARTTAAEILDGVDLTGRRMIVTGGASGIGSETVRALAGAGAEVTVATRNPASADELVAEFAGPGPGVVRAAALDLADLASVDAFVAAWEGPLHALVANAGIMAIPTRRLARQGWELQLGTNYLGHFALVRGLHDNLRAAGSARVVIVSSGAHLWGAFDFADPQFEQQPYEPWTAYARSKTAGVLLAVGIAQRWAADGITATALNPGYINTNLQRHLDDETLRAHGVLDEAGNRIDLPYYKTPAQGAATSVLLAASPLVEGVTGRYFEDNQEVEVVAGGREATGGVAAHAMDDAAAGPTLAGRAAASSSYRLSPAGGVGRTDVFAASRAVSRSSRYAATWASWPAVSVVRQRYRSCWSAQSRRYASRIRLTCLIAVHGSRSEVWAVCHSMASAVNTYRRGASNSGLRRRYSGPFINPARHQTTPNGKPNSPAKNHAPSARNVPRLVMDSSRPARTNMRLVRRRSRRSNRANRASGVTTRSNPFWRPTLPSLASPTCTPRRLRYEPVEESRPCRPGEPDRRARRPVATSPY